MRAQKYWLCCDAIKCDLCFVVLCSSEEVTTSPVTTEYWNAAPHPQLAHLPQLPHPLNNKVVTGTIPTKVTTINTKKTPTTTTKIGECDRPYEKP